MIRRLSKALKNLRQIPGVSTDIKKVLLNLIQNITSCKKNTGNVDLYLVNNKNLSCAISLIYIIFHKYEIVHKCYHSVIMSANI